MKWGFPAEASGQRTTAGHSRVKRSLLLAKRRLVDEVE